MLEREKKMSAKEMYQEKGFKDTISLPLKREEILRNIVKYIED